MKKLITLSALLFICSCAPSYVYDVEYKVKYSYVANAKNYKYVYLLYFKNKAIYLHTDKEYSIGETIKFNQN